MKILLLVLMLCCSATTEAQQHSIEYRNDSLFIDHVWVPEKIPSRSFLDDLLKSKSRTGVLIGRIDPVSGKGKWGKERAYLYYNIGLYFYESLQDISKTTFTIILEYADGKPNPKAAGKPGVFEGQLSIGGQSLTKETSLLELEKNHLLTLLGSGITINTKVLLQYSLARYQNLLILLLFSQQTGHLNSVSLMK